MTTKQTREYAELLQKAEECDSRKEAVSLLRRAARMKDSAQN